MSQISDIIFEIARYKASTSFIQEYRLAYQPRTTLMGWLTKIREELDSSLVLPGSCRAGLCGACGVRVNGRSVLACQTILPQPLPASAQKYKIEPLRGFPIVRDLIIDWRPVMERLKKMSPWLIQKQAPTHILGPTEANHLRSLAVCVTCGICVSECPILTQDHFIEPFIFIKAYRVISDFRFDHETRQMILRNLQPYLSYCIQCGRCQDTCPKGASPAEAIASLQNYSETLASW